MKQLVEPWFSFQYLEVHEIVAYKDKAIYKTRNTGKVVKTPATVDRSKYILANLPYHPEPFEVNLVSDKEFQ